MTGSITVSGRALGRRKPLFEDFSVPIPPPAACDRGDGGITLRDLIARIVRHEVEAFRQRQADRRLIHILTEQQIGEGAERGKVDVGGRDYAQHVDEDQAIATAWQALEDGLYLVVIDEQEQKDLDRQVYLRDDSRVTFIRLVFLAGA